MSNNTLLQESKWLNQQEAMEYMLAHGYHCDHVARNGWNMDKVCCASIKDNNRKCDLHFVVYEPLYGPSRYFYEGFMLARKQIDEDTPQIFGALNEHLPNVLTELVVPLATINTTPPGYGVDDINNQLFAFYLARENDTRARTL
jgi:hypothetical protein